MFAINNFDEFSPDDTILLLNNKLRNNNGLLNALPALFIYQKISFGGHSAKVSS